jgi:hypothetical protein
MDHCRPGKTTQTDEFAGQTDTQFSLTGWVPLGSLSGMSLKPTVIVPLVSNRD